MAPLPGWTFELLRADWEAMKRKVISGIWDYDVDDVIPISESVQREIGPLELAEADLATGECVIEATDGYAAFCAQKWRPYLEQAFRLQCADAGFSLLPFVNRHERIYGRAAGSLLGGYAHVHGVRK